MYIRTYIPFEGVEGGGGVRGTGVREISTQIKRMKIHGLIRYRLIKIIEIKCGARIYERVYVLYI